MGVDLSEETPYPARDASVGDDRDLRLGRLEVFHTLSVDLAELVLNNTDRADLQRLRANDVVGDRLYPSLVGRVDGWEDFRDRIEERGQRSVQLGGKAVWTDYFLDRYAPCRLKIQDQFVRGDESIDAQGRLSGEVKSPLHHVRYRSSEVKMFRDGTLAYTVWFEMDDRATIEPKGSRGKPASVGETIRRLESLDNLLTVNFSIVIKRLLSQERFTTAIQQGLGVELRPAADVTADLLRRRAREHRVIFVEEFLDGDRDDNHAAATVDGEGTPSRHEIVPLDGVLSSNALAGILNTAHWYQSYNSGYIRRIATKNIGYRTDEIYLTDSKATVVSNKGFWRTEPIGHKSADPLSLYKWDVVLAVEYNIARLAYCFSTHSYYQTHPDVKSLEEADPERGLRHVIDGRAVVAHIEESLDLALLVDHGFTRLFIKQLRTEVGLDGVIDSIRGRVADVSTTVGLKSSVLAAEHTSRASLRAALANNAIQRVILLVATLGLVATLVTFVISQQ